MELGRYPVRRPAGLRLLQEGASMRECGPGWALLGACQYVLFGDLRVRMRVGVLGGGLQGCCVALALAERGVHVTLFDQNEMLLSRTAIANAGKIHLGYMYANDPSLATACMMMR